MVSRVKNGCHRYNNRSLVPYIVNISNEYLSFIIIDSTLHSSDEGRLAVQLLDNEVVG